MRRSTLLLATAALVAAAPAPAEAQTSRDCGEPDEGVGIHRLRSIDAGCRSATRVARRWQRRCSTSTRRCRLGDGYRCTQRRGRYYSYAVACRRENQRVYFLYVTD